MTVLERILQLKEERNWSEYRLSEESGIAQSTISSWFRKNINPSISSLENICSAFHITLSQFFAYDNTMVDLTDLQQELLQHWSKLSAQQQQHLLEFLKTL